MGFQISFKIFHFTFRTTYFMTYHIFCIYQETHSSRFEQGDTHKAPPYRNCYNVLKPGSFMFQNCVMLLVLKNISKAVLILLLGVCFYAGFT
jgi:hypothetical protein